MSTVATPVETARIALGLPAIADVNDRENLCSRCRAALAPPSKFRIGDQIWRCTECGQDRAWGLLTPADRDLVPALECEHCCGATRHRYVRVA